MRPEHSDEAAVTIDHPAWAASLPTQGRHDGLPGVSPGAVCRLDPTRDEVRHLLSGASALVPLVGRGALRVTGADRVDFVQGQVSHDVRGLASGGVREALLLDHRGRPQADLVMVRREHDLYLAVDDGRSATVRAALDAHVVFDQVVIEALDERLASFVLSGRDVLETLGQTLGVERLPVSPELVLQVPWRGADVMLHARPRGLEASLDVHLLSEHLPPLWSLLEAAGAVVVGERALAAARVAAGIAAAAAEGQEALPQESGLEPRVSYRKGCYLGQEIMARVEARGSLRRSLARLTLAGAPEPGTAPVVEGSDGRVVGRVGTVAPTLEGGWSALAVIRNEIGGDQALRTLGRDARLAARPA